MVELATFPEETLCGYLLGGYCLMAPCSTWWSGAEEASSEQSRFRLLPCLLHGGTLTP